MTFSTSSDRTCDGRASMSAEERATREQNGTTSVGRASAELGGLSADAGEAVPEWFRRKKSRARKDAETAESSARPVPDSPPPLSNSRAFGAKQTRPLWKHPSFVEQLKFVLQRRSKNEPSPAGEDDPRRRRLANCLPFALSGYGFSLICHVAVLVLLSVIVYAKSEEEAAMLNIVSTDAETVVPEFQEIDTRLESAGAPEQELELPEFEVVENAPQTRQTSVPEDFKLTMPNVGSGTGDAKGDGDGLAFRMPESGKVVKKGSFTAWTVPEDPAPKQIYLIVVQIELPERIRRYRRSDLSGMVVGTDGYNQEIPGTRYGWLPVKNNRTQLVIPVPGARKLVRDRINVRSRLLRESQTLEIVF